MRARRWRTVAILSLAGFAAVVAGIYLFGSQIQHRVAVTAARHYLGKSQLNLLILGYQDDEATTDTIVLAHLDVDRRLATLVSIPRDTWVAIPGGGHQKINAAYAFGGAKMSQRVVSRLLGGVPIDAVFAVQPEGAAQIVDALGGLNVDVDETMNYDDDYGDLHIHLKRGEQFLTGSQVVGYLRFRHDAQSDYGRMRRQQQVLKLLMNDISLPQNWAKLPRIFGFVRKDVHTTLSDRQMLALLEAYRSVPDENVRSFTLPSKPGWVGDASVVFVDPRWAKLIGKILFDPSNPPADPVVIANATGDSAFDDTIVAALRGAGWNVTTAVDQPVKSASAVIGSSAAARALAAIFGVDPHPATSTTLLLGSNLAPKMECYFTRAGCG